MMSIRRWQGLVVGFMGVVLSLAGVKAVQAKPAADVGPTVAATAQPLAQTPAACPETWQERQTYARVITERDPLRIRATPNGRVVGSVPKGWAVVVLERDASGQWTKITSHFGDPDGLSFGSAPYFREGWVATRFLRNLGDFCEKPVAMGAAQVVAATQPEMAQDDWLQWGDRIAQTHRPE